MYQDVNVSDVFLKSIAAVVIAMTVYKTTTYLSGREPNSVKINRVNKLWTQVSSNLKVSNVQELQMFLLPCKNLVNPILDSSKEMNARYASWVKPWNWTAEMKIACEKINHLATVFRYYNVICAWNSFGDDKELVKLVKKIQRGESRYPLCVMVNQLKIDIQLLHSSKYHCGFELVVLDILEETLDTVLSSEDYTEELRLKTIEEYQRRAAQAAERTAWAIESSRYR